jgi:hypothetical protein
MEVQAMDPLITRILLSIILWPTVVVIYFVSFVLLESHNIDENYAFVWSGIGTGFVIVVWLLLVWRSQIHWTKGRLWWTWLSVPAAAICGTLGALGMGLALPYNRWDLSTFVGTLVALCSWPMIAVFVWRENADERGRRSVNVSCPACSYNLTGLSECRCPECGAQYTIDQLYAAQPKPLAASAVSRPASEER